VNPDLERLFGGGAIAIARARPGPHADDLDLLLRVGRHP
jgi:hypothetical protein